MWFHESVLTRVDNVLYTTSKGNEILSQPNTKEMTLYIFSWTNSNTKRKPIEGGRKDR